MILSLLIYTPLKNYVMINLLNNKNKVTIKINLMERNFQICGELLIKRKIKSLSSNSMKNSLNKIK
jgi:hypothetical protein